MGKLSIFRVSQCSEGEIRAAIAGIYAAFWNLRVEEQMGKKSRIKAAMDKRSHNDSASFSARRTFDLLGAKEVSGKSVPYFNLPDHDSANSQADSISIQVQCFP